MVSLEQQRAEGQGLRRAPVDALAAHDGVQSGLDDLLQLLVHLQRGREGADLGADLPQPRLVHPGLPDATALPGGQEPAPLTHTHTDTQTMLRTDSTAT